MEASVSYFFGGAKTARIISEQIADVRLLFILRDPAERLFSYFTHDKINIHQSLLIGRMSFLLQKKDLLRAMEYFLFMSVQSVI